ncbi:SDR family oxidoreductase [Lysobacter sp. FW306-1B-D06B]|uniref:SDR family oxidoreductase n=1 Tax=Lysobacter sp. FW306-1B-D06B TaxID=3140250 RepID=UPI00314051E7
MHKHDQENEQKLVAITGANRGLGLAMSVRCAALGWSVIAGCRRPSEATDLQRLAQKHIASVDIVECDVLSEASIVQFAAKVAVARPHLDLLVNNAGYLDRSDPRLDDAKSVSVTTAFQVNALAPLLLTRELLPQLRAAPMSRIANISSAMGCLGLEQRPDSYGYRMSKAALNMFTVNLASELASTNIVVLALHPGWVKTDMGGTVAPVHVEDAVAGLLEQMMTADKGRSGRIVRYDGMLLPY